MSELSVSIFSLLIYSINFEALASVSVARQSEACAINFSSNSVSLFNGSTLMVETLSGVRFSKSKSSSTSCEKSSVMSYSSPAAKRAYRVRMAERIAAVELLAKR